MKRITMAITAFLAMGLLATACTQGNVFSLEVGQCFNDPDETEEVSDVAIVDCSETHNNEVFHLFDIPGDEFPGRVAVTEMANNGCIDAFEDFVGASYSTSEFGIFPLSPTEDSWNRADDREVVCALYDIATNESTGSARNSGR